jgi:hypothetical protein
MLKSSTGSSKQSLAPALKQTRVDYTKSLSDAELLTALRELANLKGELLILESGRPLTEKEELQRQENRRAVERYLKKWPDFIRGYPADVPLVDLLVDDGERVLMLRDDLRNIWAGGYRAEQQLASLIFVGWPLATYSSTSLDRVLTEELLSVNWRRGIVEYKPETQLQKATYLLLQNSARVKVCANPDCPAPYFIARKTIQRYCSPDCLKPFQREWKQSWWDRIGKARRDKRLSKGRKRGGRKGK